MESLAKYWKIVRLQSSGQIAALDRAAASQHLEAEYDEFVGQDPLNDRALQTLLVQELKQAHLPAALCLRCYASHYIMISCQRLVNSYGEHYGFGLTDIAPVALTDDGTLGIEITAQTGKLSIQSLQKNQKPQTNQADRFQPLAFRILEKFNPEKAGLGTWASRLTWQDSKLKTFLKTEYGILLISDWALLNDTQPAAFQRLLIKYFNFPDPAKSPAAPSPSYQAAIAQLHALVATLQVYHDIYRAELSPQRGKPCPEPTADQCQRMLTQLNHPIGLNPDDFRTEQLLPLADYIRRHRLKQLPPKEIHQSVDNSPVIPAEFLSLFDRYLGFAVAQTLKTRLTGKRMKPAKAQNLLKALHLQYHDGLTQGDIAEKLGFPRQDTVSKLLDFKSMKIGMIAHMLARFKNDTPKLAAYFDDPDRLLSLKDQLEGYLQIILNKDTQLRYTPSKYRQERSQLSEAICDFLEQYHSA